MDSTPFEENPLPILSNRDVYFLKRPVKKISVHYIKERKDDINNKPDDGGSGSNDISEGIDADGVGVPDKDVKTNESESTEHKAPRSTDTSQEKLIQNWLKEQSGRFPRYYGTRSSPGSIRGIIRCCDGFVFLDWLNNQFLYTEENFKLKSTFPLPLHAQDFCQIRGESVYRIVVAMSHGHLDRSLQFVNISGEFRYRELTVKDPCMSVATNEENVYAASKTVIYKYNGDHVTPVYEDYSASETVTRFGVASNDNIYIACHDSNTLTTIDSKGTVLATLTDKTLLGPTDVTVSREGHVYVCCGESQTIVQVHPNGQRVLRCLATEEDGVWYPKSIYYDEVTGQILVGQLGNSVLTIEFELVD